jgi:riboflavin kinase / FMN adenylyltransferase
MKIFNSFSEFPAVKSPLAITIGNFDGVHLGHQALLNRLKQVSEHATIITFSNHPSTVLYKTAITYLTTLKHRLALFEKLGIENTILIPFSEDFSKQTAKAFLFELKKYIPFSHIILGHDAVIGHDRVADLKCLAEELSFSIEYLEPFHFQGKIVSSSEIRKCIQTGNLQEAALLLNRPYSIFATVQRGANKGGALGFHTANLSVEELTLPPLGVWSVAVKIGQEVIPAVANLGHAPTLHVGRPPCLEVHLIDDFRNLYGQELEVFFKRYLRAEKRFETIEALKAQIQKDIAIAKL